MRQPAVQRDHGPRIFLMASVLSFLIGATPFAFATSSVFYQLDYPGAVATSAQGLNDSQQIVGTYHLRW